MGYEDLLRARGAVNKRGADSSKRQAMTGPLLHVTFNRQEPTYYQERLRRNVQTRVYSIQHDLYAQPDLIAIEGELNQAYKDMLKPLLTEASDDDIISVRIEHTDFDRGSFYINPMKKSAITFHELAHAIEKVSQSNSTFLIDGQLEMKVAIIKRLAGGNDEVTRNVRVRERGAAQPARTLQDRFTKSTSVVNVKGKTSCGYHSLALGMFHADGAESVADFKSLWQSYRRCFNPQRELAEELFSRYELDVDYDIPMTDTHLTEFQSQMKSDYRIYVFKQPSVIPCTDIEPVFIGESRSRKHVYLEFIPGLSRDDGHFNVITNIVGYFKVQGVCFACMKGYTNHGRHFCESVCRACGRVDCEKIDEFQCDERQVICQSEKCLDVHIEKRCHKFEYCHECEVRYKPIPEYEHKCDHKYCAQCKMEYTSNHHHFIAPLEQEKLIEEDLKNKIIVAYDIEAAQVKLGEKLAIHKANLVICHTVCDECWDFDTREALPCTDCVELERVYQGEDCIDQFCDYLINEVSNRAGKESLVDIYAHNAKNYDNRFVLRELLARKMQKHEMIMTGSKITKMMVGNLRFVDSCLHFQQRLANLPGSFNFKDRVVKGYFPHLFNDGTNWLYSGPVPAAHYFGVETMQGDDVTAFLQWHNERSADPSPWVFEDEIIKYCRNDVEILLLALQEYRKQTKAETNLDPTTRKFTLAGVAHEVLNSKKEKP